MRITPKVTVKISIHAPLTGSDYINGEKRDLTDISIHAPLTGSDFQYKLIIIDGFDISIHAPLTGSD